MQAGWVLRLLVLLAAVSGCAATIVRPGDLPVRPRWGTTAVPVVVALEGAPAAMADEVQQIVPSAVRDTQVVPGQPLATACPPDGDAVVLRPQVGRTYFATNAGDRNALFIYESAIVVGLPVTLISAVAWPWYGETTIEGVLETVHCGAHVPASVVVGSYHLRSEGRGFVRGGTIKAAQEEAAARAIARKLLASWSARETTEERR